MKNFKWKKEIWKKSFKAQRPNLLGEVHTQGHTYMKNFIGRKRFERNNSRHKT